MNPDAPVGRSSFIRPAETAPCRSWGTPYPRMRVSCSPMAVPARLRGRAASSGFGICNRHRRASCCGVTQTRFLHWPCVTTQRGHGCCPARTTAQRVYGTSSAARSCQPSQPTDPYVGQEFRLTGGPLLPEKAYRDSSTSCVWSCPRREIREAGGGARTCLPRAASIALVYQTTLTDLL
jgi:hypothetical protein